MANYDRADVLLSDNNVGVRDSVRQILHNQGFRNLNLGDRLAHVRKAIESPVPPDIMILGTSFEDGSITDLIRALRHHELGSNPFIPVITLTAAPTPELVRAVVDSGADDLLTVPVSTAQLVQRIEGLVSSRKPFVVTSDYIGPDRRKDQERPNDAPKVEVPNTLRAKVTGEKMTVSVQEMIDKAIGDVNIHRLERHANQIGWLVTKLLPDLQSQKPTRETAQHLKRLLYVIEDTERRMIGTKYQHVSDLCRSMKGVAQSINKSMPRPADKDIKLVSQMAKAIQAGFASIDSADAARKIAASVGQGR